MKKCLFRFMFNYINDDIKDKNSHDSLKDNITIKTDEKVAISVLGTILMVKQHDRSILINKLKKLNIEI